MRVQLLVFPFLFFQGVFGQTEIPPTRLVTAAQPFLLVLGIAQDGGVPQAGTKPHPGWEDARNKRHVVCLALIDPATRERWLIEATPDFREQLHLLEVAAPAKKSPGLDGIFLTHAHMGHYTGLMFLGHESLGAKNVPVFAMPRMHDYLSKNGPWDQLVRYQNIDLKLLQHDVAVQLNDHLSITPFLVPHRQEYSEVVGFRITGPNRSVLFIPDIDKWELWDEQGTRIEDMIAFTGSAPGLGLLQCTRSAASTNLCNGSDAITQVSV